MRRLATLAGVALLAAPALARAHIDVLPTRAEVGQAQEFTIRVPTERPLPTTRVRVLFPPEVTVYAFADPPAGWALRPLLAPDGRNRGVEYSGGRIGVGRYQDFAVLGTPFQEGTSVWRSFQTYADGKTKPWTGTPEPPGASSPESGPTQPGPAAAVRVLPAGAAAAPVVTRAAAASGDGDGDSSAGIWLGVIAIGIAALAAVGTGLLWSTRPATLPPDGDEDADRPPAAGAGEAAPGGGRRGRGGRQAS